MKHPIIKECGQMMYFDPSSLDSTKNYFYINLYPMDVVEATKWVTSIEIYNRLEPDKIVVEFKDDGFTVHRKGTDYTTFYCTLLSTTQILRETFKNNGLFFN